MTVNLYQCDMPGGQTEFVWKRNDGVECSPVFTSQLEALRWVFYNPLIPVEREKDTDV